MELGERSAEAGLPAAVALTQVRVDMVRQSRNMLTKEWLEHGHVHENYNSTNGAGCDVPNSNPFYHWGALLGLVGLLEDGLW